MPATPCPKIPNYFPFTAKPSVGRNFPWRRKKVHVLQHTGASHFASRVRDTFKRASHRWTFTVDPGRNDVGIAALSLASMVGTVTVELLL